MACTSKKLASAQYEHPFDRKAIDMLRGAPGLEAACSAIIKHGYERMIKTQHMGSCMRITPSACGDIYEIMLQCCEALHMEAVPQLYTQWGYAVNAFTVGIHNPIIVLNSGSIDLLSKEEMKFLIGHELGHIKSAHMLYHMMAQLLESGGELLGQATLGIGKIFSFPLQQALFYWSRMSEFTADRAGLLACGDIAVVARIMMKMAGLPLRFYDAADPSEFIQQARDFKDLDYDAIGTTWKLIAQIDMTHPWTVLRTSELIKWIETGAHDKIILQQYESRLALPSVGERIVLCVRCGATLGSDFSKPCKKCGAIPRKIVVGG